MLDCEYRETSRQKRSPSEPAETVYYCRAAQEGPREIPIEWCEGCPVPEELSGPRACRHLRPTVSFAARARVGGAIWRCKLMEGRPLPAIEATLGRDTSPCEDCPNFELR